MKLLLTMTEKDIHPKSDIVKSANYKTRRAARAVVKNSRNQVALLKVGSHNYHKLPGGGVEKGEDLAVALERELLEEIGCKADVAAEVGKIVEYRDRWGLEQTSYCYLAAQVGSQQPTAFTDEERAEGFKVVWADTIDAAIYLLEQDHPDNYDGLFIQLRDLTFLRVAKQLLV
jgi:8-oxo-dGTP diphosphatase